METTQYLPQMYATYRALLPPVVGVALMVGVLVDIRKLSCLSKS